MSAVGWRRLDWAATRDAERKAALQRPLQATSDTLRASVREILESVRREGDAALAAATRRFDRVELDRPEVDASEWHAACLSVPRDVREAIDDSVARVEAFHRPSALSPYGVDTAPGVRCERIVRPIRRVGLYAPAGSAPLPSTVVMLGVPARLAGCKDTLLCTPPRADGTADPIVLYAARRCGIARVFKIGGAQAIAAMAFGTDTVPACDKLFGPGNAWVTEAKRAVAMLPGGPAIDMPAGPSEVMVIADAGADPRFVAADLLSQAEHGADSQVLLVSDDGATIDAVEREIEAQLRTLPRAAIARKALAESRAIRVDALDDAFSISNDYAPEHLILAVRDAQDWLPRIQAAGSVFLGAWSPEAIGDYCSGTNHVLPTGGAARAMSGLSVASFQVAISVQVADRNGLGLIGPTATTLARAEGLEAHARAIDVRVEAAWA